MALMETVAVHSLPLLRVLILALIYVLAFAVRLFAVIRFESVIHEFDPYFNFRATIFLSKKGFYEWWNWFDSTAWYPLGRAVGQTLFPGLMVTAYVIHRLLGSVGLLFDIREVCVFTAPIFGGLTAIVCYYFTREATGETKPALFAALFLALSPSFMSRSVAGSFDNEAVAIFAIVAVFALYLRALNRCTMFSALLAAVAYGYLVASWGGYVIVLNAISAHILALLLLGRVAPRHYVVYSVFYVLGQLICLNIPFIRLQAIVASEHMLAHAVFILLQVVFGIRVVSDLVPSSMFKSLIPLATACSSCAVVVVIAWLFITGQTRFAGRSMTLLDPTYAAKHIPIIASVSEHQPPLWSSYIFDLHLTVFLSPVGLWLAITSQRDTALFLGVYGLMAVYFSCIMIRLMLVLSPATCALAAVGISYALSCALPSHSDLRTLFSWKTWNHQIMQDSGSTPASKSKLASIGTSSRVVGESPSKERSGRSPSCSTTTKDPRLLKLQGNGTARDRDVHLGPVSVGGPLCIGLFISAAIFMLVLYYVFHGVFAAAAGYSHPSIVLHHKLKDGSRFIEDDFREAYYWMRHNTHKDARLMSWWDYGYQTAAMSNRPTIVDNNTWNNTHIATVGLIFASPEEESYRRLLDLDVDYVFVLFGGLARYSGDDINKFLWMIRIAQGVYPWLREDAFYNAVGQFSVGHTAADAMQKSLLYRLSYQGFGESRSLGHDLVRFQQVTTTQPLQHLEEVYTTEHWLVRIYKVKRPTAFVLRPEAKGLGSA